MWALTDQLCDFGPVGAAWAVMAVVYGSQQVRIADVFSVI
jgi:hypothetical protein